MQHSPTQPLAIRPHAPLSARRVNSARFTPATLCFCPNSVVAQRATDSCYTFTQANKNARKPAPALGFLLKPQEETLLERNRKTDPFTTMAAQSTHEKFIRNHLEKFGVASPEEIARAIPRIRRAPSARSSINQVLLQMVARGRVRKLAHGVYALASSPYNAADGLAHRHPAIGAVVALMRLSPYRAYDTEVLYSAALTAEPKIDRDTLLRYMRLLRQHKMVFKSKWDWALTAAAITSPVRVLPPANRNDLEPEIDIFS